MHVVHVKYCWLFLVCEYYSCQTPQSKTTNSALYLSLPPLYMHDNIQAALLASAATRD